MNNNLKFLEMKDDASSVGTVGRIFNGLVDSAVVWPPKEIQITNSHKTGRKMFTCLHINAEKDANRLEYASIGLKAI